MLGRFPYIKDNAGNIQEEYIRGKHKQCPELVNKQQHMHGVIVVFAHFVSTQTLAIKTDNLQGRVWYPNTPLSISITAMQQSCYYDSELQIYSKDARAEDLNSSTDKVYITNMT